MLTGATRKTGAITVRPTSYQAARQSTGKWVTAWLTNRKLCANYGPIMTHPALCVSFKIDTAVFWPKEDSVFLITTLLIIDTARLLISSWLIVNVVIYVDSVYNCKNSVVLCFGHCFLWSLQNLTDDDIYSRMSSFKCWLSRCCSENNVGYINNWKTLCSKPDLIRRDTIHPTLDSTAFIFENMTSIKISVSLLLMMSWLFVYFFWKNVLLYYFIVIGQP